MSIGIKMIRTSHKERGQNGFTLIELMISIGIISLLTAIAIPQLAAYRTKGFSSSANSAVRNAYSASQAFYSDSPGGTIANEAALTVYGYRSDSNIPLIIGGGGTIGSITIQGTHVTGGSTFTIDASGTIARS
jgi:prepilin-type N-terminal cleavage/methylation domain-containing protein